jgi:hypothetical protein
MTRPLRRLGFLGIATAAAGIAVTVASPITMGPLPQGMHTPVLAFELATTVDEIETMFGERHSLERVQRASAMAQGTHLDFVLLTLYTLLLAGVARKLLPALGRSPTSPIALRRTRAALTLAVAAGLLDVLENRELLAILEVLLRNTSDYEDALARLSWVAWPKWIAISAWFVLLSPELLRAGGALRVAGACGLIAAFACGLAVDGRGLAAEVMALGIALGMIALTVGCFRKNALEAPVAS